MFYDGTLIEESNNPKNVDRVPLYFHEIFDKLYDPTVLSMMYPQLQARTDMQNQNKADVEVDNASNSEKYKFDM